MNMVKEDKRGNLKKLYESVEDRVYAQVYCIFNNCGRCDEINQIQVPNICSCRKRKNRLTMKMAPVHGTI